MFRKINSQILSLYSGMFEFGMIVDSRQLRVEREKQMQATIMATFADR